MSRVADYESFARGFTRIDALTSELATIINRAHDRGPRCGCELEHTYIHTCQCRFTRHPAQVSCDHDPVLVYTDMCHCKIGRVRYHSRDRDLTDALTCVYELERTVERTMVFVHNYTKETSFDGVLRLVQERVRDITYSLASRRVDDWIPDAFEKILALEGTLANAALLMRKMFTVATASTPAPSAQRLVELVVMALPQAHQPRYKEEFSAELSELATQSLRHQLAHASRVALRVWSLRRTLTPGSTAAQRANNETG